MNFGWIACEEHGIQHAWFICVHVIDGAKALHCDPWNEKHGGALLCRNVHHDAEEMKAICEAHVKDLNVSLSVN